VGRLGLSLLRSRGGPCKPVRFTRLPPQPRSFLPTTASNSGRQGSSISPCLYRAGATPHHCLGPVLPTTAGNSGGVSLGIVPIASYFAWQKYIWNGVSFRGIFHPCDTLLASCFPGNSTFAAITAAVTANVVLVAYIASSLHDDQAERKGGKAAKPLESQKYH
jgi:hypothetical protein